jgi:hypothetical protein
MTGAPSQVRDNKNWNFPRIFTKVPATQPERAFDEQNEASVGPTETLAADRVGPFHRVRLPTRFFRPQVDEFVRSVMIDMRRFYLVLYPQGSDRSRLIAGRKKREAQCRSTSALMATS